MHRHLWITVAALVALASRAEAQTGDTWARVSLADTVLAPRLTTAGGYLFAWPKTILAYPPGPPAPPLQSPDGIYRSSDGGVAWERVGSGVAPSFSPFREGQSLLPLKAETRPDGSEALWASLFWGGLAYSDDLGESWTDVSAGLPRGFNGQAEYVADVETVDGTVYALTSAFGLYRSSDRGVTWQNYSTGLSVNPNAPEPNLNFDVTAVDAPGGTLLFVSGRVGSFRRVIGAPGGFAPVRGGLNITVGPDAGAPFGVWEIAEAAGALFARPEFADARGALYRSVDGGLTWARADGGLYAPPNPLNSNISYVSAITSRGDTLLAGTRGQYGMYRSPDGGLSWTPWSDGIPASPCCGQGPERRNAVTTVILGDVAYVWVEGADEPFEFHSRQFSSPVSAAPPVSTPGSLSAQVRPNPSSGPARVAVTLAAAGPATVTVADALGRVVWQGAGVYPSGETTLALPAFAPGVYAVRVESAGASSASRFVVVR